MTFRPYPGFTIFSVVMLAILLALGVWQVQRLHWKLDLIATLNGHMAAQPLTPDQALTLPDVCARTREGLPWILSGFAEVVRTNQIPQEHYLSFLAAMRRDVMPARYTVLNRTSPTTALASIASSASSIRSKAIAVFSIFRASDVSASSAGVPAVISCRRAAAAASSFFSSAAPASRACSRTGRCE